MEFDDIIMKNVKIIHFDNETILKLKTLYNNYKPTNIHFFSNKEIHNFQLNTYNLDKSINIEGYNVKCLIEASKFYNNAEFRYLMNIKDYNTNFYYGKIIGIGPIKNNDFDNEDFKYIPFFRL